MYYPISTHAYTLHNSSCLPFTNDCPEARAKDPPFQEGLIQRVLHNPQEVAQEGGVCRDGAQPVRPTRSHDGCANEAAGLTEACWVLKPEHLPRDYLRGKWGLECYCSDTQRCRKINFIPFFADLLLK